MGQRFAKRWKLPALFSLRITAAVKAYVFGSRKGEAKDVFITAAVLTVLTCSSPQKHRTKNNLASCAEAGIERPAGFSSFA